MYKLFFDGLEKNYNIKRHQFQEYNFIYCGTFKLIKDEYNIKIIPPEGVELLPEYNHIIRPDKYLSSKEISKIQNDFIYRSKCVCGHDVLINCFIYSSKYNLLLSIGSCCNNKFNDNKKTKFCLFCSKEHKNKSNNVCTDCRSLYKKCGICKEYKQNNYKYCSTCYFRANEKLYNCCSTCNKPKPENTYKNCYFCNIKNKNI